MKLKNLKVYLLVILSFFLFNLSTHAINLNIPTPLPGNFFKNASIPGNKKIIIQTIYGALNDTKSNNSDDLISKNKLNSYFEEMRSNLEETSIIDYATYIDTTNKKIVQSMFIQFQKKQPIAVFLRSTYEPIVIDIPTAFPDDFFKNIKESNKKSTFKILKNSIPTNDQTNINLFNNLIINESATQIEETTVYNGPKDDKNQCILISNGSMFYFFNFHYSSRTSVLKTSKELIQNQTVHLKNLL